MYDTIALRLGLSPVELERTSLEFFLKHELRLIESQIMELARKYSVQTVAELDELVKSGRFHEVDAFDDYFEFDYLEAKRDSLVETIGELS